MEQTERKESGADRRLSAAWLPSVPEIRYLITRLLLWQTLKPALIFAWSRWRSHHQARAAEAHYRTRINPQL